MTLHFCETFPLHRKVTNPTIAKTSWPSHVLIRAHSQRYQVLFNKCGRFRDWFYENCLIVWKDDDAFVRLISRSDWLPMLTMTLRMQSPLIALFWLQRSYKWQRSAFVPAIRSSAVKNEWEPVSSVMWRHEVKSMTLVSAFHANKTMAIRAFVRK